MTMNRLRLTISLAGLVPLLVALPGCGDIQDAEYEAYMDGAEQIGQVQQHVVDATNGRFYNFNANGTVTSVAGHNWGKDWTGVTSIGTNKLVFYRRDTGLGKVFSYNSSGTLTELQSQTWQTIWDDIVYAPWSDSTANAVFYSRDSGLLKAFNIGATGSLTLVFSQSIADPAIGTDEGIGWDNIVPVRYGGDDCVFLYSRLAGLRRRMCYNGSQLVTESTIGTWTRWDQIGAGQFDSDSDYEIVYHNQDTGDTRISDFEPGGNTVDFADEGAASTSRIAIGKFGGSALDDVMIYQGGYVSNSGGRAMLYTDNAQGAYSKKITNTGWSGTWNHVVPTRVTATNGFLLFRNPKKIQVRLLFVGGMSAAKALEDKNSARLQEQLTNADRAYAAAGMDFELDTTYENLPNSGVSADFGDFVCGAGEEDEEENNAIRDDINDWILQQSNRTGKVTIMISEALGKSCSSPTGQFVALARPSNGASGPTELVHELGHYFRTGGHLAYGSANGSWDPNPDDNVAETVGTREEIEEFLEDEDTSTDYATIYDLDADHAYVSDTLPALSDIFWTSLGKDGCNESETESFTTNHGTVGVNPVPRNVLGSNCDADDVRFLSKDQTWSTREWLYTGRASLL